MTIALDSVTGANTNPDNSVLSWSHVVGGGNNRALFVGIGDRSNRSITSVTFGSQSLKRVSFANPGTDTRAELWVLVNPTTGTSTITVTASQSTTQSAISVSFIGVDQSSPVFFSSGWGGWSSVGTADPIATMSVPSSYGMLILDVITRQATGDFTVVAGQTEIREQDGTANVTSMSTKVATNGVTTMGWTQNASQAWAHVGISVNPAYQAPILSKQGTFQLSTAAATNTQVISGVGFLPKAVLFWWEGTTSTGDASANGDTNLGFGVAISTSSRRCLGNYMDDAAGSAEGRIMRDDSCIVILSNTTTVEGLMDVSSMDADGFTLIIDDAFASAWTVHYLALGGGLTSASLLSMLEPAATGNQTYTGAGFAPDFMMILSTGNVSLNTVQAAAGQMVVGAAMSSANRGVVSLQINYTGGVGQSLGYGYDGECLARTGAPSPLARADFVSFGTDGLTLNWLERVDSTRNYFILCLKGGAYSLDTNLVTSTSTTAFARTGYGFKPTGALYVSHVTTKSTQDTMQSPGIFSIGGASGPSNRSSIGIFQTNGGTPSDISHWSELDELYSNYNVTPSVQGLMDLQSFDADGQTLIMDDADPSAMWVMSIAFGGNTSYQNSAFSGNMLMMG